MIPLNYPPPEGFLEPETRCGHFVSKEMKEIWAVELDLAQKLLEVCKKYNLKIFADFGTLLGAVRHKGFIPWDDDMDFAMFRDDYEKLRKVAKTEFTVPYSFYACDDLEGSVISCYAKLRNANTTAIIKDEWKRNLKCNQGIFIDIYPLDNVPDSKFSTAIQKKMARIFVVLACAFSFFSTRYYESSSTFIRYPKKIIYKMFRKPSEKLMKFCYVLFLKIVKKSNKRKTSRVQAFPRLDIEPHDRSYFENAIESQFEYIQLPINQFYDSLLKTLYGDYKVFKKGGSLHEGVFFDANHPYTDYIK